MRSGSPASARAIGVLLGPRRDPSGRERSKGFGRKIDAERFLVAIEDAKLRGAYVDPAAGRVPFAERERTTATLRPRTRKDDATLLKTRCSRPSGTGC